MSDRISIPSSVILGTALAVVVLLAPSTAPAGLTGILVPAYFNPAAGDGWNRLDAAAARRSP